MEDNKELFDQIRKINLPLGEYVLAGSAPLGIRNLKKCKDLDVLVSEKLWNILKKDFKFGKFPSGEIALVKDNIEFSKKWFSEDANSLIKGAEIIDDLPFIKLEEVLKYKLILNREKDVVDIKILEKLIKNNQ